MMDVIPICFAPSFVSNKMVGSFARIIFYRVLSMMMPKILGNPMFLVVVSKEFVSSKEAVEIVAEFAKDKAMEAAEHLAEVAWNRWIHYMQGQVLLLLIRAQRGPKGPWTLDPKGPRRAPKGPKRAPKDPTGPWTLDPKGPWPLDLGDGAP